jgi:hypothetical protein
MTAVQWLVNEIDGLDTAISYHYFKEKINQALKMEKQQIIDAKDCWFEDERDGEQYYNETYKPSA